MLKKKTKPLTMSHFRWWIVFLCFLLDLINYCDRTVISYAIAPIKKTLHLNNLSYGVMISVFAFGGLSVNLISGYFSDHFSSRKLWLLALTVWSITMILMGCTTELTLFLVWRYVLGLGEGANFPLINRTVSRWVPTAEQNTAISIALIGVPFANFIGAPILSNLIYYFSWQAAFIFLGILGFLILGLFFWLYRNLPKESPFCDTAEIEYIADGQKNKALKEQWNFAPIKFCLTNPTLLANYLGFFAFSYILFFYIAWLPGYLEQTYHLKLLHIGWLMMIPWGLSSVSVFLGGYMGDRLLKKTGNKRLAHVHFFWIGLLLSALCFIPLLFFHNTVIAFICLSAAISFALFTNAFPYSICRDITETYTGVATGLLITFFSIAGILSPLVTGWLSNVMGNFYSAIVILIIITLTASAALFFFAKPN